MRIASRILSPSERSTFCPLRPESVDEQGTCMLATTRFLGVRYVLPLAVSSFKLLNGHRWAVKEAAYKALYPLKPTWKDLTYTTFDPQTGSKPALVFHPNGGNVSDQRPRLHVSVSHDGEYILAHVVAEHVACTVASSSTLMYSARQSTLSRWTVARATSQATKAPLSTLLRLRRWLRL